MQHKTELDIIRNLLLTNQIDYNTAKKMAAPHLEAMNTKAKEIALKFGVKPRVISFAAYMR
jgi:hypothetical protein